MPDESAGSVVGGGVRTHDGRPPQVFTTVKPPSVAAAVNGTDMAVPESVRLVGTHVQPKDNTPSPRTVAGTRVIDTKRTPVGTLVVTVEGPSYDAVSGMGSRALAFAARFDAGFGGSAGIEASGPPYGCNEDGSLFTGGKVPPAKWRQDYVIRVG